MSLDEIIEKVEQMTHFNSEAKRLAKLYNLDIVNVSWDDNARHKYSSWGPCISDMTLQVNGKNMPVIRNPNYNDKTWDVKIDKIPLVVGNESYDKTNKLKTIKLSEYLKNFDKYMTSPPKSGRKINLLREKIWDPFNNNINSKVDTHVIMSSQACFLPIPKGEETSFNVALYNYQSRIDNPAVLVIVSTSKGTSAQIIENKTTKLLFNSNGIKADFKGQRLTDNRIERGVKIQGEMTKEEKQQNVILIIQIPLKQKVKKIKKQQQNFFSQFNNQQFNYLNTNNNSFDKKYNLKNPYAGKNIKNYKKKGNFNYLLGVHPDDFMDMSMSSNNYSNNNSFNQNQNNNNDFDSFGFSGVNPMSFTQPGQNNNMSMSPFRSNGNVNNNNNNDLFGSTNVNVNNNNSSDLLSSLFDNSNNNNNNNNSDIWSFDDFKADVESAIIKVSEKTVPVCDKCNKDLKKLRLKDTYKYVPFSIIKCDKCKDTIGTDDYTWTCSTISHKLLCYDCGNKQLKFKELNNLDTIQRDNRYPIRVTLQYYKSTENGIINNSIMNTISILLNSSSYKSDFIGSLVTQDNSGISRNNTEWVKPKPKIKNMQNNKPKIEFKLELFNEFNLGNIKTDEDKNYSSVIKLLDKLDLKLDYLHIFKENELDNESLLLFSSIDELKEIVPKLGIRLKLWKEIKLYQKNKKKLNSHSTNSDPLKDLISF